MTEVFIKVIGKKAFKMEMEKCILLVNHQKKVFLFKMFFKTMKIVNKNQADMNLH